MTPAEAAAAAQRTSEVRAAKKRLRSEMARVLKTLSPAVIAAESQRVCDQIRRLPVYQAARNVSVYLSMPDGELQTAALVDQILADGKGCFVPVTLQPPRLNQTTAADGSVLTPTPAVAMASMRMLEVTSTAEIAALPRDRWGIPTVPLTVATERHGTRPRRDVMAAGGCALVIVPGVAFDAHGGRLGHGKGFYDTWLRGYRRAVVQSLGVCPMTTLAVALSCQLVAEPIPREHHDVLMDGVLTATGAYGASAAAATASPAHAWPADAAPAT